jgi:uncharacterized membrane protein
LIFDVFLLFSSATAGLILGFYSLFNIEQIIRAKNSPRITSIIMSLILLMISFGMYLGRFLRFNSWDIFINHLSVIKNIWKIFSEPSGRIEAYLYTLLFFLFLVLSYKSWKYSNIRQNQ